MSEDRMKYIANCYAFIGTYKKQLDDILNTFNWTIESLQVPEVKYKEFGDANDVKVEESGSNEGESMSTDVGQVRILDSVKGISATCYVLCHHTLASETLYNELLALEQPKSKNENKSKYEILVEMLKMERDAKRRRISYKNKVHTKNKSHTEVLRELVQQQMETLTGTSEDSSGQGRRENQDKGELFEVGVLKGNPHLAWQKVGMYFEERGKKRSKIEKDEKRSRKVREDSERHKNEESRHKSEGYHHKRKYNGHHKRNDWSIREHYNDKEDNRRETYFNEHCDRNERNSEEREKYKEHSSRDTYFNEHCDRNRWKLKEKRKHKEQSSRDTYYSEQSDRKGRNSEERRKHKEDSRRDTYFSEQSDRKGRNSEEKKKRKKKSSHSRDASVDQHRKNKSSYPDC